MGGARAAVGWEGAGWAMAAVGKAEEGWGAAGMVRAGAGKEEGETATEAWGWEAAGCREDVRGRELNLR